MAATRKLTLTVLGNAKGAVKALSDTQSSAEKFGSSVAGIGKKVAVGFTAIAAATTGAAIGAKKLIDQGSNLAESMSKVDVVFGDSAKTVQDFAKTSAQSLGISQQSALEAAGTYGNLLKAFGLTNDQATEFSTSMVTLAADLASFNNTSVDDALLALRSGLSGETEPLKRFGIALNDTRLKEEALRMGLIKTTSGTLPIAIKTQAAYALIMKDSALAQGDFARTSDGVANKQRIISAQFKDVSAQIGTALIPAFQAGLNFIGGTFLPLMTEFSAALTEGGFGGALSFLGQKIKEGAPIVFAAVADFAQSLFEKMLQLGSALWAWVEPQIPTLLSKLAEFQIKINSWIINSALPSIVNKIEKFGDAFVEWVSNAASELGPRLVNYLKVLAEFLLNTVIPKLLEIGGQLLQSMLKWTVQLGFGLLKGLGGALVALVAALPELFGAFIIGLGKIAINAVQWFVDKFMGLKDKLAGVAISVVNFLIDTFNKTPLIPNIPRIEIDTKKLGNTMQLTGAQLGAVNERFHDVNAASKKASSSVSNLNLNSQDLAGNLAGGGGGSGKKGKSVADSAAKAKQQLDSYISALKGTTSAQKAASEAGKGVVKANNDLLKANIALEEAQRRFNQAVSGYGVGSKEATDRQDALDKAQRDVERAGYGVESALFAVTQAEQDLQDIRNTEGSTPQEIREAEIRLAESKLSVKDAIDQQKQSVLDQAEAERLLDQAINGVKEGSEEYTSVLDELTAAQERQLDAVDRVVDAREREAEAIDKVREAEEKLAELRGKTPAGIIAQANAKIATSGSSFNTALDVSNPVGGSFNEMFDPSFLDFSGIDLYNLGNNDASSPRITNITVNTGIGDKNEIANELVDLMKQYERTNGYLPITAAFTV